MTSSDQQSSRSSPSPAPTGLGPADPLARLRGYRVRPDRARDVGEDVLAQMKQLRKTTRTESAAIEAWETVAPDAVQDMCRVGGVKSGRLVLLVASSSQRFVVDRWLSSGGLAELRALARVPLRGVEVRIGPGTGPRTAR